MALVNSKKLFEKALAGKYALGAFNFVNFETLQGILNSAKVSGKPVIIQSSVGAIKYMDIKVLQKMVYELAQPLDIDVCWNLDHGKTFEDCKMAVDCGFTNVMIDASDKPFEENIALTKQVVEYAHAHGVTVEAELGTLAGIEDEINVSSKNAHFTNPNQAYEFATRTNIDSLAIAIGTSHGAFKFKGEPKLRFDILQEIQRLLPNLPLVLHGASSIPQELVQEANKYGANIIGAKGVTKELLTYVISTNVCKINIDSDLRIAYLKGIRENLTTHPENIDIRMYLKAGQKEIEKLVLDKITTLNPY